MKISLLIISFVTFTNFLLASPEVCHRCEVIREENAKQSNPYPYYEDYLKAQESAPAEN